MHDDLDDADGAVLEHQFPGLGARVAGGARAGDERHRNGVRPLEPVAADGEVIDTWPCEVQRLHPAPQRGARCSRTGCNCIRDGQLNSSFQHGSAKTLIFPYPPAAS